MAEKIVMIALSPTMETGTIVKWHKKEGDNISSGDILCEVETDKATMDYESTVEGVLLKITSLEGDKVKVGDMIGIVGSENENITGFLEQMKQELPKPSQEKQTTVNQPVTTAPIQEPQQPPSGIKASPLARELANKAGIDLHSIKGSGPEGRIIKEDIENATKRKKTITPEGIVKVSDHKIPLSEKRKIIGQRMAMSMFSAPHFYLTIEAKMDQLITSRNRLNSTLKTKISFNSFLIKLVAECLHRHPRINSTYDQNEIIEHGSIDIALAVAQEDGLITPVVKNCSNKGIISIDSELNVLVQKARTGKLSVEEYSGGTFTISNLGSYGVRQFTAIINPPQSAILAIGEIFQQYDPSVESEGKIINVMLMTLSCDHRVIDGAVAADFARDLKNMIENPFTVLY